MHIRDFWNDQLRPFLVFSKGERNGVLFLFFLVNMAWIIPVYLPRAPVSLTAAEITVIDSARRAWSETSTGSKRYRVAENDRPAEKQHTGTGSPARLLFRPFDPNTADEQTWEAMGVPARTVRTIRRYIERGGRFRSPEDLRKIYGLTDQQYRAMRAWIRIEAPPVNRVEQTGNVEAMVRPSEPGSGNDSRQGAAVRNAVVRRSRLDINEADSAAWESLPGIGPVLARRIVRYRQSLGGFHAIDQVAETYGLADSVFERIRTRLSSAPGTAVQPIRVNSADASALATHPYISRKLAGLITAYRSANGPFTSPEDLLTIPLVNDTLLKRLRPYLSFD